MTLQLAEILQLSALKELLDTTEMLLHLTISELIKLINETIKEITVM